MEYTLIRFGSALALTTFLSLPLSAFAYLTPQEVFDPGQTSVDQSQTTVESTRFSEFVPAPPTQREGPDVIRAQQERSAALRAAAQSELTSIDDVPAPAEHPAAPEPEEPKKPSLFDEQANYDLRMQRMNEEQAKNPTIIIMGQGASYDRNGNVLHSGAPIITRTGPETTLGIAAMILAALSTFAFATIKGRFPSVAFRGSRV